MESILHLPFPVSTNAIWRNARKRTIRSRRYLTWIRAAEGMLYEQRNVRRISGPVKVLIVLGKPDKRKRDIDNLAKCVLDFMQKQGLIDDDSLVEDLHLIWGGKPKTCVVIVKQFLDDNASIVERLKA